jgi:hypothetical protein
MDGGWIDVRTMLIPVIRLVIGKRPISDEFRGVIRIIVVSLCPADEGMGREVTGSERESDGTSAILFPLLFQAEVRRSRASSTSRTS